MAKILNVPSVLYYIYTILVIRNAEDDQNTLRRTKDFTSYDTG